MKDGFIAEPKKLGKRKQFECYDTYRMTIIYLTDTYQLYLD
jgi:hypothetical protein